MPNGDETLAACRRVVWRCVTVRMSHMRKPARLLLAGLCRATNLGEWMTEGVPGRCHSENELLEPSTACSIGLEPLGFHVSVHGLGEE